MPNHVINTIKLTGDKDKIYAMLEAIKSDEFGIGTIDFNKIIPMPESLNIEAGSQTERGLKTYRDFVEVYNLGFNAEDSLERLKNITLQSEQAFLRQRKDIKTEDWQLGKQAFQNLQKYGTSTWYDWSIANWETKWNAYGYEKGADYSGSDSLSFQTAWSAPHPVIEKLAEMYPDIGFEHTWADEDIGQNCGCFSYDGGERTEEYTPETDAEAVDFACKAWDYDPKDMDLCLNSTGSKYIGIENSDYQLIELLGKPALFTNERLTDEDIPQGLYCYHLREGDDGNFCSVEPKVGVNHGGSVITDEPIDFGEQGYVSFADDTSPNFRGEDITLGQYMRGEFEQPETQTEDGGMQL